MSSSISRRRVLGGAALSVGLGLTPFTVIGAAKPRVVVVGGGAGGATVARYVAESGAVDVTLVEPNKVYSTCFFSNLYLGGLRSFESITHGYDRLSSQSGVTLVHERADSVDTEARTVRLASGATLPYDRLVVAPGIDFKWDAIEGYDERAAEVMPHAYKAGAQTRLLRAKMEAVPDGGLFVITAPPNPFRCPPGPYERACMVANYFKREKPRSKILIIDSKNKHSKQDLFQAGWARFYPDMIEWLPADMTAGGVTAVNTSSMEVMTADETFKADAVNVIPPQMAGTIAHRAGLADDSGWCPVHAENLASTRVSNVHLVGDAIIPGDMPKSGFSANSQAKVCASALLADLADKRRFKPRFRNTCWSLVSEGHAIKVGASYEAAADKISKVDGFISAGDETDEMRASTAKEAEGWYSGISKDIFG